MVRLVQRPDMKDDLEDLPDPDELSEIVEGLRWQTTCELAHMLGRKRSTIVKHAEPMKFYSKLH